VVEYRGFRNTPDRREYVLLARAGPASREYTLWIATAAFAKRQALLQDGPDICYQKLRRVLSDSHLGDVACIAVTEDDLAEYRAAHAPRTRQGGSPPPRS
jgi:hypothetical protein